MAVLIGALLAILVIGVVLYPFIKTRFRPSPRPSATPLPPVGEGLRVRVTREAIYEEIRTLQLEYELGSIEESEYRQQLRSYRLQAASALRDQERLEQELDRLLEEEILAARAPSHAPEPLPNTPEHREG